MNGQQHLVVNRAVNGDEKWQAFSTVLKNQTMELLLDRGLGLFSDNCDIILLTLKYTLLFKIKH